MAGVVRRKSYTVEYKVKALDYLEEHSVRATAEKFQVERRMVKQWRENEAELRFLAEAGESKNKRKLHPGPPREAKLKRLQLSHPKPEALLVDLYGTVVDWRSSVKREFEILAKKKGMKGYNWGEITDRWYVLYEENIKQIRSGEKEFIRLDAIHRDNLHIIIAEFNFSSEFSEADIDHLARAWQRLKPWEDSVAGIARLRKKFIVGAFSNANLALAVQISKFSSLSWDVILGAELVQRYKPGVEVYLSAADYLGLSLDKCMVVSAHHDDLQAARDFGLKTCFINRPKEFGARNASSIKNHCSESYDIVVNSLEELATNFRM